MAKDLAESKLLLACVLLVNTVSVFLVGLDLEAMCKGQSSEVIGRLGDFFWKHWRVAYDGIGWNLFDIGDNPGF